jgi:hypothetical protein
LLNNRISNWYQKGPYQECEKNSKKLKEKFMNNIKAILNLMQIAETGNSIVKLLLTPGRALKMTAEAKRGPLLVPYILVYTPLLRATMRYMLAQKGFTTWGPIRYPVIYGFYYLYGYTCLVMCE